MAIKTLTNITEYREFVNTIARLVGLHATEVDVNTQYNESLYSATQCAKDSGFSVEDIEKWVRAINRRGQAIFYGSPGTGKTFIAEKLARHITGGTDGFIDLIQFHPAYSYEDFIEGIRPKTEKGQLSYSQASGRFLEFCERARMRNGNCVLIIDEINRANLSRVFGELMYLLEYRDKEMVLSGGTKFCIPSNVRIIGTMNTADRSIALVDHALRRRFSFIPLTPRYEVIESFHKDSDFDPIELIKVLRRVNELINDKHYHIGISFFLKKNLSTEIAEIWNLEIEPYLEEYFYDQQEKLDEFRWPKIKSKILGSA
jgi:5-methylcytosine-specific restriction protein B